ncbi:hypothetical protein LWI28_019389 [Acer negundo]|uniref:Uncharacterized protein n=1 Tax=Acer negundo TaxID=4023 RepID=A0AAD5NJA8_ACENE|nr:hypothetical protein LWI28_019389 [Acer negundo]
MVLLFQSLIDNVTMIGLNDWIHCNLDLISQHTEKNPQILCPNPQPSRLSPSPSARKRPVTVHTHFQHQFQFHNFFSSCSKMDETRLIISHGGSWVASHGVIEDEDCEHGSGPASVGGYGCAGSGTGPSGAGPSGVSPSGAGPSGVSPSGVSPSGFARFRGDTFRDDGVGVNDGVDDGRTSHNVGQSCKPEIPRPWHIPGSERPLMMEVYDKLGVKVQLT